MFINESKFAVVNTNKMKIVLNNTVNQTENGTVFSVNKNIIKYCHTLYTGTD